MRVLGPIVGLILALALTVACSGSDTAIDDAPVHVSTSVGSADYPTSFAFGGGSDDGLEFLALGGEPLGTSLLRFDARGRLEHETQNAAPAATSIVGLVGDPGATSPEATFVVGSSDSTVGWVEFQSPGGLEDTPQTITTEGLITGTALGDINGDGASDLIYAAPSAYFGDGVVGVASDFRRGDLVEECLRPASGVALADFDPSASGPEVAVVAEGAVDIVPVAAIRGRTRSEPCGIGQPLMVTTARDFGRQLFVADFDGNGRPDLAASSASEEAVIIVWNPDGLAVPTTTAVVGSDGFGAAIAVGDLTGDGLDDLIVGSPDASSGAGRVEVVSFSQEAESGRVSVFSTEENGRFGRAVGVGRYGGTELLVVGDARSVHVHFRGITGADPDPRTF